METNELELGMFNNIMDSLEDAVIEDNWVYESSTYDTFIRKDELKIQMSDLSFARGYRHIYIIRPTWYVFSNEIYTKKIAEKLEKYRDQIITQKEQLTKKQTQSQLGSFFGIGIKEQRKMKLDKLNNLDKEK